MAQGRLTGVSWRELSSEPTPTVSPAGSTTAAKTMTSHAALGSAPSLRLGGTPLPVLGSARVYVCGITPYETTHVGHATTFVWADVAARVLRLAGANVEVCRNVTDVDDHVVIQAKREGVPWRSLAIQETYRFERDMAQLGVVRPTYEPRSRDYVDEVIARGPSPLERRGRAGRPEGRAVRPGRHGFRRLLPGAPRQRRPVCVGQRRQRTARQRRPADRLLHPGAGHRGLGGRQAGPDLDRGRSRHRRDAERRHVAVG